MTEIFFTFHTMFQMNKISLLLYEKAVAMALYALVKYYIQNKSTEILRHHIFRLSVETGTLQASTNNNVPGWFILFMDTTHVQTI